MERDRSRPRKTSRSASGNVPTGARRTHRHADRAGGDHGRRRRRRLATAGGDNFDSHLAIRPPGLAPALAGLAAPPTALAVSPDKKSLAVAAADGAIRIYDLATKQIAKTLSGHAGAVTSLTFQANGATSGERRRRQDDCHLGPCRRPAGH